MLEVVREAIEGGVRMIQVRDKRADARTLLERSRAVLEVAQATGASVVVNDRLDVALAAGAHGVHLGSGSLPAGTARSLLPESMWIGVSAHDEREAVDALDADADYVFFGPVFDTPSKRGVLAPRGLERLRAACDGSGGPVFAIGGMDAPRAARARKSGAYGIAVISSLFGSPDVRAEAARLVRAVSASP